MLLSQNRSCFRVRPYNFNLQLFSFSNITCWSPRRDQKATEGFSAPLMFDTSPWVCELQWQPNVFYDNFPPVHQVQYSPQQEFQPLQGSHFFALAQLKVIPQFLFSIKTKMIYWVLKEVIPFKYLPFPPIWSFANWPAPAVHNWWIRPMHWFSCNYLLGHFLISWAIT